ncbi:MAG: HAD-IC family P-type ATPase [Rhodopseudomonas palustris]|nr:HAD-IC family P-type ATPase [Rhodopseudomonas palustris]
MLVALLVCLIPTTIGGLLSAIGIAGMDRHDAAPTCIAMSGRAVEAAGDVDVLLLDKTGTITLGNRQATELHPGRRRRPSGAGRRRAAGLAGRRDARGPQHRGAGQGALRPARARPATRCGAHFVPFIGPDAHERRRPRTAGSIRKGAADADRGVRARRSGGALPADGRATRSSAIAARGRHAAGGGRRRPRCSASIHLKDIVKGGIKERFAELRRMGIKTVMITGDNPLTAAAIAAEAGVDDFLAEATPEAKLALIREHQAEGRLVAMTGDGTNDAPALAQADVGGGDEHRHAGGQGGRQHGRPRLATRPS